MNHLELYPLVNFYMATGIGANAYKDVYQIPNQQSFAGIASTNWFDSTSFTSLASPSSTHLRKPAHAKNRTKKKNISILSD